MKNRRLYGLSQVVVGERGRLICGRAGRRSSRILCLFSLREKRPQESPKCSIFERKSVRLLFASPPSQEPRFLSPPPLLLLCSLHFPIKVFSLAPSYGQTLEGCRLGDLHPWDRQRLRFLKVANLLFWSSDKRRERQCCNRADDAPVQEMCLRQGKLFSQ